MKKGKRLTALLMVFAMALSGCAAGSKANTKPFIKYDEKVVTNEEFDKQFDLYKSFLALQNGLDQQVKGMILQDYIISEDLKKNEVKVEDKDYQDAIAETIESVGGEVEYLTYLNKLRVEKEVFEQSIKSNVNYKKHLEWFNENNKASDEDIAKYFEENKDTFAYVNAKHILVNTEEEANKAIERLNKGEKFEDVSNDMSIDEAAKAQGGDLGKVQKALFDKDFVDAAFKLEKDKVSEPVKTKFGYHVIVVTEKHDQLEDFKEDVNKILNQQKYEEYMQGLMEEVKVTNYDFNGKEIEENKDPELEENKENQEETKEDKEEEKTEEKDKKDE